MMAGPLPAAAVRSAEFGVRNAPHSSSSGAECDGVDGQTLRCVFRRIPSPVAIVTARNAGEMRGITIGSLASVSLHPPLISFNVEREAQMHTVLAAASGFVVHLVGTHQTALCRCFAAPGQAGSKQFDSILYGFDVDGNPLLDGALVVLRCRTRVLFPAGDHSIVVGEVVEIQQHEGGAPLVYYNRSYRGICGGDFWCCPDLRLGPVDGP